MAVNGTGSFALATVSPAGGLLLRVWARLAAPRLDARLAAGEGLRGDCVLARRSAQLVSKRTRRRIAAGVERVCDERREQAAFSAAIPTDWRAVEIARPALEQLATALRSRESVEPRGVASAQLLLTDGSSPLYRPAYPEQLYEVAREALLALSPVGQAAGLRDVRGWILEDQLGPR